MKFLRTMAAAALAASLFSFGSAAGAGVIGPTPYLSFADSPFNPAAYTSFYFDDLEDGAFNLPGASVSEVYCITNEPGCFQGSLVDSVGNGGNQTVGHSLWSGSGSVTLVFDKTVLGSLPVAAGLVWTDGLNPIHFEAFDQNGASLGVIIGNHADGSFTGGTAEDRFYGATNAGGISRIVIFNPPAIEVDHIQFGVGTLARGVPEPAEWALLLIGLAGAGVMLRRARQAKAA